MRPILSPASGHLVSTDTHHWSLGAFSFSNFKILSFSWPTGFEFVFFVGAEEVTFVFFVSYAAPATGALEQP